MSLVRIAMDGPAGAGKSTIAKRVARELGIDYIDTGAMYRAFALKILRTGTDLKDADALAALLKDTDVDYAGGSIFLDGENVDGLIRTQEDQGIVVVMDSRIVTRRYGQAFLNSIPECPKEVF